MISIQSFKQIYFYRPYVDFRKGMNGLCAMVQEEMKLDLFDKHLFIFTNSKRDKIKALYWDRTGFALWVKYLIDYKYKWPIRYEQDVIQVDVAKLNDFLQGLDPFQLPFEEKNFSKI